MNTKTKELRIDRTEENIVVALDKGGKEYFFSKEVFPVSECDIIEVIFDDNENIIDVTVKTEETAKAKEQLKTRLANLFKK